MNHVICKQKITQVGQVILSTQQLRALIQHTKQLENQYQLIDTLAQNNIVQTIMMCAQSYIIGRDASCDIARLACSSFL